MAGSLNKVMLIGHLGADPEVRHTGGGQAVANFRVATTETWNDKSGQRQEKAEWHRITVWGKLAELCGEYLKKGRQVYVEGNLQTREWTDKEGKKNSTTEVVARSVTFLGGNGGGGHRRKRDDEGGPGTGTDEREPAGGGTDEEIPF